ncbi:hypothetical protein WJX84_012200 [Apatococcus fuscideae]|uniref:Protein kinase domain-containing protein n=1 Tax=Apatococcus fuscideae TaxID=2026836 RepID=A0AAW1TFY9_9CHLO
MTSGVAGKSLARKPCQTKAAAVSAPETKGSCVASSDTFTSHGSSGTTQASLPSTQASTGEFWPIRLAPAIKVDPETHSLSPLVSSAAPTKEPLLSHPKYKLIHALNEGTSGFVQLAEDLRTGEQFAIKFMDRGRASIRNFEREVLNLRLCSLHPHIVKLHEVFLTADYLAIVLEYAAGGDLATYIGEHCTSQGGLTEGQARWLFQQLVVATDFCHRLGIVNRDIKLENVLISGETVGPDARPQLKLADFGYSKDELCDSVCKTACGTPEYVAPEVLLAEAYDGKTADVWSLGVLLYILLTGGFPFREQSDSKINPMEALQVMFRRICSGKVKFPPSVSEDAKDLLLQMLAPSAAERLTVKQLTEHRWFRTDLALGMLELNDQLLQIPSNLQQGFCKQNEAEILAITAQAQRRRSSPVLKK